MLLVLHGRGVERRLQEALEAIGLSLRTFGILGHLAADPGRSLSDVARRARITPQSVQAIIRSLVDAGIVVSPTGGGRGRPAALELTQLGQDTMREASRIVAEFDVKLFTDTSPAWQRLGAALRGTLSEPPDTPICIGDDMSNPPAALGEPT